MVATLLQERFTCRAYKPDEVAESDIREILNQCRLTPSWCNTQPWHVVVTRGAATARLSNALYARATSGDAPPNPDLAFPEAYRGVYDERRRACGALLYSSQGILRGDSAGARAQALENSKRSEEHTFELQ